jgi:hypothetical protein
LGIPAEQRGCASVLNPTFPLQPILMPLKPSWKSQKSSAAPYPLESGTSLG